MCVIKAKSLVDSSFVAAPVVALPNPLFLPPLHNIHNGNVFNFLAAPKATTPRCTLIAKR